MRRNNSTSAWTLPGTAVLGTGSNSSPVVSRTGITSIAGDFGIGSDQTINALPVKLIVLSVMQDKNDALLKWQTASEENSDRFEVERSIDNTTYNMVGNLIAAGNSTDIKYYKFKDDLNPLITQNISTVYYRLKQVDKDGTIAYSNIITLNLKSYNDNITLYPLPLNNLLNATTSNGESITQLVIMDMNGKEIIKSNTHQIDVSAIASGMYLVKIDAGDKIYFQKITK
jgi:hypothetical protein